MAKLTYTVHCTVEISGADVTMARVDELEQKLYKSISLDPDHARIGDKRIIIVDLVELADHDPELKPIPEEEVTPASAQELADKCNMDESFNPQDCTVEPSPIPGAQTVAVWKMRKVPSDYYQGLWRPY